MTLVWISLIVLVVLIVFLRHPGFGRLPSGERLQRIINSPNYRDGSFQNISHTPALTEGTSYITLFREFFFEKHQRNKPTGRIPSVKTDLKSLPIDKDILVWFGHSSYYLQLSGKRILVDPVLGASASPLPYSIRAFDGTDVYTASDLPDIDILFITHDHWDHLDFQTLRQIQPRVAKVICGLGVGAHLEHWGYNRNTFIEKDWNEVIDLGDGFVVNTTTARHFSGRGFRRNKTLWMSFVLSTPAKNIYIGGDSGYDVHFKQIGNTFGPFDLAILENGQYDRKWRYIHMLPDEIVRAGRDLKARRILPVHSGKFALANHAWDEPLNLVVQSATAAKTDVITPMIGESVDLDDVSQTFPQWWKDVK